MEILDDISNGKKGYFNPIRNRYLLAGFGIMCLLAQIDALYADISYNDLMYRNPDLMICFYSPYSFRILVIPLMVVSMVLTWKSFDKNARIFSKENIDKLILGSPIIIFGFDIILSFLLNGFGF